jgi:hypothetical protein
VRMGVLAASAVGCHGYPLVLAFHEPCVTSEPVASLLWASATNRFHASIDLLNTYMDEYNFPLHLRTSLRMYFIHCRYVVPERSG